MNFITVVSSVASNCVRWCGSLLAVLYTLRNELLHALDAGAPPAIIAHIVGAIHTSTDEPVTWLTIAGVFLKLALAGALQLFAFFVDKPLVPLLIIIHIVELRHLIRRARKWSADLRASPQLHLRVFAQVWMLLAYIAAYAPLLLALSIALFE